MLEAIKRGLNNNLSWNKYNHILYSVERDIIVELGKYYKHKE